MLKTSFIIVLFLSKQPDQLKFIFPPDKRNTQPVTAGMGICSLNGQELPFSCERTLWDLIMRSLGSVKNIKCA